MSNTTILYSYQAEKLHLQEALSVCREHLAGAVGLLYSPLSCFVVRLADGVFHHSDGALSDTALSRIFEARIFNQDYELRWLNEFDETGNAVLLADKEVHGLAWNPLESISCEYLKQQYLLWGEKIAETQLPQGWQRLAEARIGKLDVPLDPQLKESEQRIVLKTQEYLAAVDHYGNYGVIEERLVKLEGIL
ncbi:MAG: CRISPR-associated protein Csx19 [Cyanobacteria bacterium P01_H01_bin.15]